MSIIEIHDEEFARWLEQTAEQQNRSVEDVLKTKTEYPQNTSAPVMKRDPSEGVRRVRLNAYAKARRYWESVGDNAKAALTDEELDQQFHWFDEEGIPRLKSEVEIFEPRFGSLPYLAMMADLINIRTGHSDVASHADEILKREFGDYLLRGIKGSNALK